MTVQRAVFGRFAFLSRSRLGRKLGPVETFSQAALSPMRAGTAVATRKVTWSHLAAVGGLALLLPTSDPAWAQAKKAEPAKATTPATTKDQAAAMPDAFASLPASAAPAPKKASFEELLKDAVPVKDLATLIEPLYARCEGQDAVALRQCEGTKSFLLEYLKSHTFVADADVQPDTTPYDAAAKQVDMEVPGCLACKFPPTIAGETRFVSTSQPQRIVEGRAVVMPVASHEISLPDRTRADRFVEKVVPRLRVQHVFTVGAPYGEPPPVAPAAAAPKTAAAKAAPAVATVAALKGVLITSLGHRVYDRCTGQIAAASPPTTAAIKVAPDKTCPRRGIEEFSQAEVKRQEEIAALPERLFPRQIDQVLAPIQAKIHECYVEFGEPSGTAKVNLIIGNQGKLSSVTLPAPFDKSDIAVCLRSQIKSAVFPKFRGEPMTVDYVYQVQ